MSKEGLARLDSHHVWQALASAVTFFYIAIAITGLWLSGPEIIAILQSFTIRIACLATPIVILSLAAGLLLLKIVLHKAPVRKTLASLLRLIFETETSLAIAIKIFIVIVWYFAFSTHLPDFVYRGF